MNNSACFLDIKGQMRMVMVMMMMGMMMVMVMVMTVVAVQCVMVKYLQPDRQSSRSDR